MRNSNAPKCTKGEKEKEESSSLGPCIQVMPQTVFDYTQYNIAQQMPLSLLVAHHQLENLLNRNDVLPDDVVTGHFYFNEEMVNVMMMEEEGERNGRSTKSTKPPTGNNGKRHVLFSKSACCQNRKVGKKEKEKEEEDGDRKSVMKPSFYLSVEEVSYMYNHLCAQSFVGVEGKGDIIDFKLRKSKEALVEHHTFRRETEQKEKAVGKGNNNESGKKNEEGFPSVQIPSFLEDLPQNFPQEIEKIKNALAPTSGSFVCEPYKLLVYGQGDFFTAHRDTMDEGNMVGSLSLQLPVVYDHPTPTVEDKGVSEEGGKTTVESLHCSHYIRGPNGPKLNVWDGTFDSCHTSGDHENMEDLCFPGDAKFGELRLFPGRSVDPKLSLSGNHTVSGCAIAAGITENDYQVPNYKDVRAVCVPSCCSSSIDDGSLEETNGDLITEPEGKNSEKESNDPHRKIINKAATDDEKGGFGRVSYTAWYGDTVHEVSPVQAGRWRVVIIYRLYASSAVTTPSPHSTNKEEKGDRNNLLLSSSFWNGKEKVVQEVQELTQSIFSHFPILPLPRELIPPEPQQESDCVEGTTKKLRSRSQIHKKMPSSAVRYKVMVDKSEGTPSASSGPRFMVNDTRVGHTIRIITKNEEDEEQKHQFEIMNKIDNQQRQQQNTSQNINVNSRIQTNQKAEKEEPEDESGDTKPSSTTTTTPKTTILQVSDDNGGENMKRGENENGKKPGSVAQYWGGKAWGLLRSVGSMASATFGKIAESAIAFTSSVGTKEGRDVFTVLQRDLEANCNCSHLAFILRHQYPSSGLKPQHLKGIDLFVYETLRHCQNGGDEVVNEKEFQSEPTTRKTNNDKNSGSSKEEEFASSQLYELTLLTAEEWRHDYMSSPFRRKRPRMASLPPAAQKEILDHRAEVTAANEPPGQEPEESLSMVVSSSTENEKLEDDGERLEDALQKKYPASYFRGEDLQRTVFITKQRLPQPGSSEDELQKNGEAGSSTSTSTMRVEQEVDHYALQPGEEPSEQADRIFKKVPLCHQCVWVELGFGELHAGGICLGNWDCSVDWWYRHAILTVSKKRK